MGGSHSTNDEALQWQKEQAAEADAKEQARQARLTQGKTLIDQIFSGSPVMDTKTSPYDWSTFKEPTQPLQTYAAASGQPAGTYATGVPTGYTAVDVAKPATSGASALTGPGVRPAARVGIGGQPAAGAAGAPGTPGTAGGGKTWALQDAGGKTYYQGDPFDVTTSVDTGKRTGGFDDAFYSGYGKKYSDYYGAAEDKQYREANRDLLYNLTNAGLSNSTAGAGKQGDLAYNDALAKSSIVSNANQAVGNLKAKVQSDKESVLNQLYSTEDPTLSSDLAQSAASADKLVDPTTTPIAAFFAPALTAAGAAAGTYLSPYQVPGSYGYGGGGPSVSPAGASRGKPFS